MTLAQLLPLLRERGVRVWVENAQLRFTAPKGALTPELKSALTLHKETLLSVLGGPTAKPLVRTHARDARSEAPLSFAQQRLWLLEKLNPGSAVYNIPSAIRLKGKLDVEAMRRSFEEIVRRHEALRTIFSEAEDDGDPKQTVVPPPPAWKLPIIDVADESEMQRLATEEALRPFSLETGPLLRTTLLRLRMDEHVLLFTTHHIASDGWSDAIVIDELTTLYRAYCGGKPSPLKDLDLQYGDFARWQRSPEQERVLERETQYWRDKLRGLSPLELPTDRPRPPVQSSRGALARRKIIDADLVSNIRRLGAEHEATTFMVLLAAFHVLLARYSGQSDIAVGTPIANRTHKETEPLIGFFVNTLVIRARVDRMTAQRFEEVLKRTREAVLGAYAHQDVPFERIVAELQPERDRSRSPLFQVMFALQNAPTSTLTLPELTLEPIDTPTTIAKFDLTLSVLEIGTNGFDCGIEYNTDLFDHDTIEVMLEHYERVLRSYEQPRIDLLTHRERHHLVVECNDTHQAYPDSTLLHELFEAQVERTPHAIALAFGFGAEKVTYDDLNRRANRLAHHLCSLGVASDVLVGVCLDRSIHMVVTLLAILKAGGAYVPLDPEYPRERLNVVAKDLSLIVTDSKLAAKVDASTNTRRLLLDTEELGEREDNPSSRKTTPLSTAYVLYTSGSTGVPKGVAIAHRSVVLFVHSACRKVEKESLAGVLFSTSIAFDMSVFELFAPLAFGGAVVLARDALDLKTLEAPPLPITLVHTVPSVMREWIHLKALPQSARVVALGGESLARDLVTSIFAEFPHVTRVLNTYGPTEDTVWSIAEEFRREDSGKDDRPPAIGVSIDNRRAYVLDANDLDLVPCGVVGELWVAGDGLARGYLNQPALTADRFRPDPFSTVPGSRMYRTGDLARRRRRRHQGGVIECLGRVDFQVKLRGFRIELQEIEALLLEHPDVRDTVVIAKDEQLVAYCVVKDPRIELANVLRDHLARALPKHMVPSVFVALDALPLTSNGKVDRKALPTPSMTTSTQASARDVIEMRLVAIWQELLEQPAIGIRDNFFHVGGHSLIAVRLMSKLRAEFGCDLPLATLFEHPTVEAFARLLREPSNRRKKMGSLVAMQREGQGSRPTLFCVHPKGGNVLGYVPLANALGRDQPLYALQSIAVADETIPPDDTIEKMARRYVDAIREVQPSGPYHLLGYSIGGAIAYAMALDLVANNNENVASLILVDAPSPAHLARDRARDQGADTLDHFIDEYRLTNAIDHAELRALIEREGDEAALAHVLRIAAGANVLPRDIDLATVHRLLHVMTTNLRAASSYRPLPLPPSSGDGMKVTLIRPNDEEEDDSLGWADVVGREMMTIHKVGGDHITMLTEPHVAHVAQLIVGSISR